MPPTVDRNVTVAVTAECQRTYRPSFDRKWLLKVYQVEEHVDRRLVVYQSTYRPSVGRHIGRYSTRVLELSPYKLTSRLCIDQPISLDNDFNRHRVLKYPTPNPFLLTSFLVSRTWNFCGSFILRIGEFLCFAGTIF